MFTLGADVGFGCLHQILQSDLWVIGQCSPFAWPQCNAKLRNLEGRLRSFSDALRPRIGIDHILIAMQQLSYCSGVMDIGGIGDDGGGSPKP